MSDGLLYVIDQLGRSLAAAEVALGERDSQIRELRETLERTRADLAAAEVMLNLSKATQTEDEVSRRG